MLVLNAPRAATLNTLRVAEGPTSYLHNSIPIRDQN